MNEQLVFLLMISMAIFCVTAKNLRNVICAMGVFSLMAALCYLMYHAPDVAIAEAVIGSALPTILYIIALKKYHCFYVYCSSGAKDEHSDVRIQAVMDDILHKVTPYCASKELEPQVVYTWEEPGTIAKEHVYDLIIHCDGTQTTVYGIETDDHYHNLEKQLIEDAVGEVPLFASLEEDDQ